MYPIRRNTRPADAPSAGLGGVVIADREPRGSVDPALTALAGMAAGILTMLAVSHKDARWALPGSRSPRSAPAGAGEASPAESRAARPGWVLSESSFPPPRRVRRATHRHARPKQLGLVAHRYLEIRRPPGRR